MFGSLKEDGKIHTSDGRSYNTANEWIYDVTNMKADKAAWKMVSKIMTMDEVFCFDYNGCI